MLLTIVHPTLTFLVLAQEADLATLGRVPDSIFADRAARKLETKFGCVHSALGLLLVFSR
jgi:hypothetical protein